MKNVTEVYNFVIHLIRRTANILLPYMGMEELGSTAPQWIDFEKKARSIGKQLEHVYPSTGLGGVVSVVVGAIMGPIIIYVRYKFFL